MTGLFFTEPGNLCPKQQPTNRYTSTRTNQRPPVSNPFKTEYLNNSPREKMRTRTGNFPISVIPVPDPSNLSIYFTGLTRESIVGAKVCIDAGSSPA